MEFFEVIKKRHCCRNFAEAKPVPQKLLKKVLAAGQAAPSAGHMQDWRIKLVQDKKTKGKLAELCTGQAFISQAPLVLVISSDLAEAQRHYGERGVNLYAIQDTTACVQNMFLAITALGLGACWVGAFNEIGIQRLLKLPKHWRPLIVMPLGWPRQRP